MHQLLFALVLLILISSCHFDTQFAKGKLPGLKVFGTDYDTRDGSCIRDFVSYSINTSSFIRGASEFETNIDLL